MADTLPDLTKTIDLRTPLQAAGNKVDQLLLKPPTVGQRRKAEAHFNRAGGLTPENATRHGISLVASVSGASEAIIEQMDVDQFEEATAYLESFTVSARRETAAGS